MLELPLDTLHGALAGPVLLSMNLLNDIASNHPDAISFAAGRPFEELFQVSQLHEYLDAFVAHLTHDLEQSAAQVRRTLYQYGRTKGVIHHLVAKYLEVDEGIRVDPESIVVATTYAACEAGLGAGARAASVSGPSRPLCTSPHPPHGLSPAYPPLTFPLLRDVVVPVLVQRFHREDADAARRLASLMQRYLGLRRQADRCCSSR